ncbi:MAG: NIPSNAP family protein [Thermoflexales bacterium]|nr:NIPSNAP family protein [Thermoflexales bacterium]
MIYQLRVYWAAPGKLDALNSRFRNLTLRLFARYDMHVVGFWTPEPRTEESGDLVYMLAFPDAETCDQAWTAFRADEDWKAGKAASEAHGPLLSKLTSHLMTPTDYSPMQ